MSLDMNTIFFRVVFTVAVKTTVFGAGLYRLSKLHLLLGLSNNCCDRFLDIMRGYSKKSANCMLHPNAYAGSMEVAAAVHLLHAPGRLKHHIHRYAFR